MKSVRLRLLVMALMPLAVLMPLLLFLGMSRWNTDYDKVLIANVESDLRIAEQYLARIMTDTGSDLEGVAESIEFAQVLEGTNAARLAYLGAKRSDLELDFLYYVPRNAMARNGTTWPVIDSALSGTSRTEIDIFPADVLASLSGEGTGRLDDQARVDLIETEAAVPTRSNGRRQGHGCALRGTNKNCRTQRHSGWRHSPEPQSAFYRHDQRACLP